MDTASIDLAKSNTTKMDGVSVWNTLIGKPGQHSRNDLLYWHGWGVPQAIRVGKWKLYVDQVKQIPGSNQGPVLIDLNNDPRERTNLSIQHPERVRKMRALALRRLADIASNSIPLGGPKPKRQRKLKRARWLQP